MAKSLPATASGGTKMLRAFAGPFPTMRFCPTGGIHQQLAANYLALSSVACVGGSWKLPAEAILAQGLGNVRALAHAAASVRLD